MKRYRRAISSLIIFVASSALCHAQKARAYYDELYKAGGLDRKADGFVCFAEEQKNENFFIFARSEVLKAFLMENGSFKTLPAGSRAILNKGFLAVRTYNKGVPLGEGQDLYMKDGDSWLSDPFRLGKDTSGRMRLRISFDTLRYRRSVEATKDHITREAATAFGRCELISPGVEQKGE